MTHELYVFSAYALAVLSIAGLLGWIIFDQKAQRREIAELEAAGVRRRSERGAERK